MLVECIPNFSEGRRPEVVARLVATIEAVPGVRVLDHSLDADHNRSVISLLGPPESVLDAMEAAVAVAVDSIDLSQHLGAHPRIGAVDVIPFVPIAGLTMQDCVELAWRLGERVSSRYGLPVYFYEEAAKRPERRNLADVRRGNFEGLARDIQERLPDMGPPRVHPTAGAVAIGARKPLVAYNVVLGTDRLEVAKAIVKRVRARDGGLGYVKAMAVTLKERRQVQVSMNLVDFTRNAMYTVFEMVKMEAERWGVPVVGSEIVGLVPMEALAEVARYYLRLEGFKSSQVLESHLIPS
ncbi:MAG: glutamate formimidoyltransferase [Candidatus Xenobia bacterium]